MYLTNINISEFKLKIGYDVSTYLDEVYLFYENDYKYIVNFYLGKISEISEDIFVRLRNLITKAEAIDNKIRLSRHSFNNYLHWEIVEYLTNVKIELYVTSKLNKFLRSTKANNIWTSRFEFNRVLRQSETLESLSRTVLNSNDYDNEWIDIAIRNNLSEIDYNSDGGNNLALSVNLASRTVRLKGVIDFIVGKRVFGLDIKKKLEYNYSVLTSEGDDFITLSHDDTIKQAVEVLSELVKGDVPEFLDLGRSELVGDSIRALGISALIRQLVAVFSSDDTLTDFNVKEVRLEGGDYYIDFTVSTRFDLIINRNIRIA